MSQIANDTTRIILISDVFVEIVSALLNPENYQTYLQQLIEQNEGYDGLTNSEYYLAVMKACASLQSQAFDKFTSLEHSAA